MATSFSFETDKSILFGETDGEGRVLKFVAPGGSTCQLFVHNFVFEKFPPDFPDERFVDSLSEVKLFVKLLYGFRVDVDTTFNLLPIALKFGYKNIEKMTDLIRNNLNVLESTKLIKFLNMTLNRANLISRLTLRQIRNLSRETEDVELLRLLIDETISRYGQDTKELKRFYESKLAEHESKNPYSSFIESLARGGL